MNFSRLAALLVLVAILPGAQAQIVADHAAPAAQQPAVLSAGNGVPLVNIRTPSAAGVSRNTYSQFDVGARGAILNNARNDALTQLGGWVQGNPHLAAGTARIILNEIHSASPSLLAGYIEVAGSRAQVVLANPAGVTCSGCGFINASRATLTTGTPIVSGGALEGYRVERGKIVVEGEGLDASRSDYTDLIARAVEVNAGLWANQLKITAGANRVDADHSTVTPIAAVGPAPVFAIDVASLGGMYAGKIHLIGTEAGVGVRNAGALGASAGDIVVTAAGRLENAGRIEAAGHLVLDAAAGIQNSGTLYSRGNLDLATRGDIGNTGILAAHGDARLAATGAASRIDSAAGSALGAGILADGGLGAKGDLDVEATQTIAVHGQNLAAGSLSLAAGDLDLGDSQSGARAIALTARAGDLATGRAVIEADGSLSIEAAQTLRTDGARVTAGALTARARALSNRDGQLLHTGAGEASVRIEGALDNTRGVLASNGGTLGIEAAALDNSGGRLLSLSDLAVRLAGDYTNAGELHAEGNARLEVAGHLDNRAKLIAGDTIAVTAASLENAAGAEIAATHTHLAIAGTLTNRGLIDGADTRVDAGNLANLGTGRLYGDTLSIAAATLNNDAEAGAAPVIAARRRLDLGARDILNREHALIFSAGDMAIGGALDTDRHATGQADTLTNASATIEALGELAVSAARIDNDNLYFSTREIHVGDETINEYALGGTRYAPRDVTFTWTLNPAARYAPPDTGGMGYMGSQGFFSINEDNYVILNTPGGSGLTYWLYEFNRSTDETQVAGSDPGRILSGGAMRIDAGTLDNDLSHIIAGGALTAAVATLINTEASGTRSVRDTGTANLIFPDTKHDDSDRNAYAYAPAPALTTLRIAAARFEAHIAPPASGTTVPGLATGSSPTVAGVPVAAALPTSGLYRSHPGPSARYLVETDARFAGYRQWLSSDWMLAQLGLDPAASQKRLGDGFYEQRLIREQVASLTGRRFLDGHSDDEAQYRALIAAGVTYVRRWNLIPGVALTAEQMAGLTTDMVWLVEREVTLADGSKEKVLAPQLYARVREGDVDGAGALIAGDSLQLDLTGDLANLGTLAGRQVVALSAENITNLGGRIRGADAYLAARQDIHNLGGSLEGEDRLTVLAGRDLKVESTSNGSMSAQGTRANLDRLASLYVTNPGGQLVAAAGRDLDLIAAALINAAPTAAGAPTASLPSPASGRGAGGEGETAGEAPGNGSITLLAGRNLTLGTLTEAGTLSVGDAKHNRREAYSREIGTTIQTTGDLTLSAGEDLNARAAQLTSQAGAISLSAGRDLTLAAGEATQSSEERHKTKRKGLLSTKKTSTFDAVTDTQALSSTVSGDTVSLSAGGNLTLTGSSAVSQGLTSLDAGGDIAIQAAEERHSERHEKKEKQSGVFGSGGAGFTIGSRSLAQKSADEAVTAAGSTVGSIEGDVIVSAGLPFPAGGGGAGGEGRFTLRGSEIIAPQGDIAIAAKQVDIVEARERRTVTQEVKTKQSGLTVAFSNPVVTAVQTAQSMGQAAKDTKDDRMKALAAASTALAGYNAYQSVTKAPDQLGGIGINLSLGSSKSKSTSTQTSDTAAVSHLTAGRDITITALTPSPPAGGEGGGEGAGDITAQGAELTAGRHLSLAADDEIKLLAARNAFEQKSSNKSGSAGVGVGYNPASGFSVTASASQGKGKADGRDVSHSNTHATAGDTLTLQSGGDTTIRGAVARGEKVIADIGGKLAIESLQDTSTYKSKQQNAGFSVSVSLTGGLPGGSVSAGQAKVTSDYAGVTEQSALRAGNKGFDVAVAGDTTLTAGAITSTQQAIDENRNRFETGGQLALSDIHNRAEYQGKSVSVNLGAGFSPTGELTPQGTGAGFGQTEGKAESTTLAAISGIAGNTAARTGDAETGLKPIFDQDKVQKEIDAQVAITQTFGQLASKAVGDYAQTQTDEAKALRAQGREQEAKELEDLWGANGTLRLAAHTLIGALTGGMQGAAGAAAGTLTAPLVAQELAQAGIEGPLATTLTALASTAAGAAVGGAPGAGAAFNEVGNNYLRHQEATRLVALRNQKRRGNCDAGCDREIKRLEALDLDRNRILAACEGVTSSHCDTVRAEVRLAAAEYIRAGHITPEFRYDEERQETVQLAQNAMGGIRLTDGLIGAGETLYEGVAALASGVVTGARALLGNEQAKAAVRQGAGAAWEYVRNPENWPVLLGAMTPEDREKLAAAYEKGDAGTIGRMLGAQAANMPIGGGFGTIKRVERATDKAADATKLACTANCPVDVTHSIGADYNPVKNKVTGGHTLLNDDVRIIEIKSPPDANGVYEATVELRKPNGEWAVKTVGNTTQPLKNTMFPQHWDAARVRAEIESAWARRTDIEGKPNMWKGMSSSGVEIQGYKEPRATAYPVYSGSAP